MQSVIGCLERVPLFLPTPSSCYSRDRMKVIQGVQVLQVISTRIIPVFQE